MFDKALKYLLNDRPDKALPLFKKLPLFKEVALNLGSCYKLLGNDDKAREMFLVATNPRTPFTDGSFTERFPEALNNLGLLAYTYQEDDVAIQFYLESLKGNPNYTDAKWNLGNALLRKYCSGKYDNLEACWTYYEYRFKRTNKAVTLRSKKQLKEWSGEYVESLCILAEQGFGDQLMFARYLDMVAARVGKLEVQCEPRMQSLFSKYTTCTEPTAEYGIGICSLGRIFNTIPNGEWLSGRLSRKLADGKLDIGVTWSGNPNHANNKYRSTTPHYFRSLGKYGDLYTLNPTEANTRGFKTLASGNWGETISELSKLDVVVSVDTSIVHLCGCLGMPCYVLMPLKDTDFRWGDDSMGLNNIWYPSVRVIRNPGSWDITMQRVGDELTKDFNSIRTN